MDKPIKLTALSLLSVLILSACSHSDSEALIQDSEDQLVMSVKDIDQGMDATMPRDIAIPKPVTSEYADITRRTTRGSVEIYSLDGGFESDRPSYAPYNSATTTSVVTTGERSVPRLYTPAEAAERVRRQHAIHGIDK